MRKLLMLSASILLMGTTTLTACQSVAPGSVSMARTLAASETPLQGTAAIQPLLQFGLRLQGIQMQSERAQQEGRTK